MHQMEKVIAFIINSVINFIASEYFKYNYVNHSACMVAAELQDLAVNKSTSY